MKRSLLTLLVAVCVLVSACFSSDTSAGDLAMAKKYYKLARQEQNLKQRLNYYKKALNQDSVYRNAWIGLADTFEKLDQFDEAIENYQKAVTIDPNYAISYFGLGDCYIQTGQYGQALASYDKGLALEPNDGQAIAGRQIAKDKFEAYKQIVMANTIDDKTAREYLSDPKAGMSEDSKTRTVVPVAIEMTPRLSIPIRFSVNSFELSLEARNQLDNVANALQTEDLIGKKIIIEGHTDDTGKESYNLRLSIDRANSVKFYLCSVQGLPSAIFSVKGFGESRPLAPEKTEFARSLNRRVEFVNATW